MAEGYSTGIPQMQMQSSQYGQQYTQVGMEVLPHIKAFEMPIKCQQSTDTGAVLTAIQRELEVHNLDNVTYEEVKQLLGGVGEIELLEFPARTTSTIEKSLTQAFASAYVKYKEANVALEAYRTLNGQNYYGKTLVLSFVNRNRKSDDADRTNTQGKNKRYRIFVGSLPRDADDNKLRLLFEPFGAVVEAKVVFEPQTKESRGFGFVTFETHLAAETAIGQMNNATVEDKQLQTNWAILRQRNKDEDLRQHPKYHEVYYATFPRNSTVYVGGLPANVGREAIQKLLQAAFKKYGTVRKVVVSKCLRYAFITYDTKLSATLAILAMDGKALCGADDGPTGNFKTVKCSWATTLQPSHDQANHGTMDRYNSGGYSTAPTTQAPASNAPYWSPGGGNRNRSGSTNHGYKQQNLVPVAWNVAQDSYDHGRNQYAVPYGTYMNYAPNYNYRPYGTGQGNATTYYNTPVTNNSFRATSWTGNGNQSKFHQSNQSYRNTSNSSNNGGYSERKSYSSPQSNESFPNSGRK